MPQRLLVLNVVLGLVSLAFAVGIVRTLVVKHPLPSAAAPRTVAAPQAPAIAAAADPGADAYGVIPAQNLFNPARSETATVAVAVVKPILHGIVIDGAKSRAFLEDPAVKRVGGYSVGDSVSGGKIQKIADDRVVIARPEGMVEVLLQDPSKPRPAPTPTPVPAGAAAQGQVAPGQANLGQVVPGQVVPGQAAPGQVLQPPSGPPANQPASAVPQFRRRVPLQGQPQQ